MGGQQDYERELGGIQTELKSHGESIRALWDKLDKLPDEFVKLLPPQPKLPCEDHKKIFDDHEARLRTVEKKIWVWAGGIMVVWALAQLIIPHFIK